MIAIGLKMSLVKLIKPERENVVVGLRPEALNPDNGEYEITVPVDMTEMLGSEKIVYFYLGTFFCLEKVS